MTTENNEREMFRGESLVFDSRVTNENGAPYDLTGAKLWMTAKYTYAHQDSDAVFQLTTGDGITIQNAVQGKIEVNVDPTRTRLMPDGINNLVYDIKLKDQNGRQLIIEAGTLKVKPSATRATE